MNCQTLSVSLFLSSPSPSSLLPSQQRPPEHSSLLPEAPNSRKSQSQFTTSFMSTSRDKNQSQALYLLGGKALWTKDFEVALLEHQVDMLCEEARFPAIREHLSQNIGGVYKDMDLTFDEFPKGGKVDPEAPSRLLLPDHRFE
ncbi:hypothetical protein F5880DRAFT_1642180 [Lentinula raphanica]|nr:hypothetical protein F5880DRAFT_1642180 [Lentinula raphanica]